MEVKIRIWEVTHFWKVCFWLMGQVNAWEGMPKPLCTHAFHFLTHSIHVESLSSSRRRMDLSPSRLDVVSPFRHAQKLVWGFAEWMCNIRWMIQGFLRGVLSSSRHRSLLSKYLHIFLLVLYFCIPRFLFVELCSEWAKETHDLGMDGGRISLYNS